MSTLQPIGPHDVRVHGRKRRFHVAGIETVVQTLEKFSVAGHGALLGLVGRNNDASRSVQTSRWERIEWAFLLFRLNRQMRTDIGDG